MENIREYEENHVKAAQHMAEERLSLSNQLAKLKYQYVIFSPTTMFYLYLCLVE